MGFKASFNAFIYSINTPPPSPDPAKTPKSRKNHTKTTASDPPHRQPDQILESVPSESTQQPERQAARERNRARTGTEADPLEGQVSSPQVVSFADPSSGQRRPNRESRRHRSRANRNRPEAEQRPTGETSETTEHPRAETREARRERRRGNRTRERETRERTGERPRERARERAREQDSRESTGERCGRNNRERPDGRRDRNRAARREERIARREERSARREERSSRREASRRSRDHANRRRNQVNPAFPPPINIQEASRIRIRRPVPPMPLSPEDPNQLPVSSPSTPATPSTLPDDSSDEAPEYDVNDMEIPPYRASLHKYLDLMSFDPRFVPCLRINRSLVRNHDKLQESIHEFKRFNKLPNSVDLWKINHVDDAHFDDILPDLIPYPLPRQRPTNQESELQPHDLQAINDYEYALFLEQQERAMAASQGARVV